MGGGTRVQSAGWTIPEESHAEDKLEFVQGVTVGWEKFLRSGLLVLEKLGPSGKEPVGMFAGIMANRFPIAKLLIQ